MNKLKTIRIEKFKMTQEQFARQIGCTFSTVSRWEHDKATISVENVKKIMEIAERLKIDLSYEDII